MRTAASRGIPLLLLTCCLSVGCRKSEKSALSPPAREATKTGKERPRTMTKRDRLEIIGVSLKMLDPKIRQEATVQATILLTDAFRRGDIESLREIVEYPGIECEQIGSNLADILTADEIRKCLDFLALLNSQVTVRVAAGVVASDMFKDPQDGYALLADVQSRFDAMLAAEEKCLYDIALPLVAKRLFTEGNVEQIQQVLGLVKTQSDLTNNTHAIQGWNSSIQGALCDAINAGDSSLVGRYLSLFPEQVKQEVFNQDPNINSSELSFASTKLLLDAMIMSKGIGDEVFTRWGQKIDWAEFRDVISSDSAFEFSSEKLALLKGWVSQRPKFSTETLAARTGNPALVQPAFATWTEANSMEASQWLKIQPDSRIKDACTEELCDYLFQKGSTKEARAWLSQVPEETRIRLETKYKIE